jgi:hypothetical protein
MHITQPKMCKNTTTLYFSPALTNLEGMTPTLVIICEQSTQPSWDFRYTYRHQVFQVTGTAEYSMQWRTRRSRPYRCLWWAHPEQPTDRSTVSLKKDKNQSKQLSKLIWNRNRNPHKNVSPLLTRICSPNWKWAQYSPTAIQGSHCTFSLQRSNTN